MFAAGSRAGPPAKVSRHVFAVGSRAGNLHPQNRPDGRYKIVAPAGIEPASSESESEILSIEIRSHGLGLNPDRVKTEASKINVPGVIH